MMTKTADLPALLRVLTLVLAMTSSRCDANVIDLTHQLKEGESMTWPVNPKFNFSILYRAHHPVYNTWLENNLFEMPEHMGTHMDAPAHMEQGTWRMHQVPVERLVGPGVLVDVREKVKVNPVYKVTLDDLKEWESQHGKIPEKAVVLMNTGWASRYPDWNRVFGTDDIMDLLSFKYPSISEEAARWLSEERSVIAVGIDSPSPDNSDSYATLLKVHKTLLPKDILILENVANVNSLPPKDFTVFMGALKIFDGSGAPMRMVAISGGCKLQITLSFFTAAAVILGLSLVRRLGL